MRVTQEKILQYVGTKYGEDIANKQSNKLMVVLQPPKYSSVIMTRQQEWETLRRRKQTNLLAAL
jgi:hypothetical protein